MIKNNRKSRNILCGGVLLLAGSIAVPSIASEFSGGYVGAGIGAGRDKLTGDVSAPNKTAAAGGVEAGYNWDIGDSGFLLGVDGFYDQTKKKTRFITDNITPANSGDGSFGDKTFGVDGKVGYAMDKWLPYVKLGFGKIKGTGDLSDYSKKGTHFGVGTEYKLAEHLSLGGELTRFNGKELDGTKGVNNSLFLKLKYYFDSKAPMAAAPIAAAAAMPEPTPAPAPEPAPAPAPRMEKLTLSATELFAFDSDQLAQPQPKLDELAQVLNSNKQIEIVTVYGYTDRLGSDSYNMKLSQRRADTVKAYLVSKGVDASRINSVGKGKANPVVECKDKNRTKLIKCLEPNRRIEVEQVTYERRVN